MGIKMKEQAVPDGFTVLTTADGDQIARSFKEAQYGLFSCLLLKGMEGGADSNRVVAHRFLSCRGMVAEGYFSASFCCVNNPLPSFRTAGLFVCNSCFCVSLFAIPIMRLQKPYFWPYFGLHIRGITV